MAMDFRTSETKENLMRAFAGESQARNRYTIAAEQAKKQNLQVVYWLFHYTAGQERAHAEVFYDHLKELSGETIKIDGTYPVDISEDMGTLLRMAQHNEQQEHEDVYQKFGEKAKEEGFLQAANSFFQIAEIEKMHGERFGKFAEYIEQNKLFVSDLKAGWICLNCGHIYEGTKAPEQCPACKHDRGYFLRLELSPFAQ